MLTWENTTSASTCHFFLKPRIATKGCRSWFWLNPHPKVSISVASQCLSHLLSSLSLSSCSDDVVLSPSFSNFLSPFAGGGLCFGWNHIYSVDKTRQKWCSSFTNPSSCVMYCVFRQTHPPPSTPQSTLSLVSLIYSSCSTSFVMRGCQRWKLSLENIEG